MGEGNEGERGREEEVWGREDGRWEGKGERRK